MQKEIDPYSRSWIIPSKMNVSVFFTCSSVVLVARLSDNILLTFLHTLSAELKTLWLNPLEKGKIPFSSKKGL